MLVFQGGGGCLHWGVAHIYARFNTIIWISAHLVETPRQRPAAAQFRSLTFAVPH